MGIRWHHQVALSVLLSINELMVWCWMHIYSEIVTHYFNFSVIFSVGIYTYSVSQTHQMESVQFACWFLCLCRNWFMRISPRPYLFTIFNGCLPNFIWSILEYLDPYETLNFQFSNSANWRVTESRWKSLLNIQLHKNFVY